MVEVKEPRIIPFMPLNQVSNFMEYFCGAKLLNFKRGESGERLCLLSVQHFAILFTYLEKQIPNQFPPVKFYLIIGTAYIHRFFQIENAIFS